MNEPLHPDRVSRTHGEFGAPAGSDELSPSGAGRRRFFQLLGGSLALAGHGGCRLSQPKETIVPYVRGPEYLVPGKPLYYATATTLGGYATGVLVENHLGRPTKIEGNPDHPASVGGTDAQTQAAVLSLYDPQRSQAILREEAVLTWDALFRDIQSGLSQQESKQGSGLRILTQSVTSPTLAAQIDKLLEKYPEAKWHCYEPFNRDHVYEGAKLAFGKVLEPRYDFSKADVIVSLDADFLSDLPGHVRYARQFAARRVPPSVENGKSVGMNRLHVAESSYTITGAAADHRLPITPGGLEAAAFHLAKAVGLEIGDLKAPAKISSDQKSWFNRAAHDLRENSGSGLLIAGDLQPAAVHALTGAINSKLGNIGATVEYTRAVAAQPGEQMQSLSSLVEDMQAGTVDILIVLGGNPVYDAPPDIPFESALAKVARSVHLSLYEDETSQACQWHVPAAHELESWSDARAFDGTVSLLQPLVEPLYGGKTAHEMVAMLLGDEEPKSHDLLKSHWRESYQGDDFESFWRRSLHDGVVPDSRLEPMTVSLALDAKSLESMDSARTVDGVSLLFRPDPTIHDGRFANNAWLQELPKPTTTLTWDNAALLSPATASRVGATNGRMLRLKHGGKQVRLPALVVPGHAEDCITLHFGYGRTAGGELASGAGFDVNPLRRSSSPWLARGAGVEVLTDRYTLARTQMHHRMEGREPIVTATLEQFRRDPDLHPPHAAHADITLYQGPDEHEQQDCAWGMSIDLGKCIGCSACVVACQAENNIPVVGKEEVARGHEMHWIRVDQYIKDTPSGPNSLHQPVTCMHCENAPCEVVCPVAATVHSNSGLNEMVYNRCVGTRYCSNNCPYKVRRFNFFEYTDKGSPVLELLRNPDVTVRSRGVMEKCTYCVQRINSARIEAKKENRRVSDGEVVTACQQACPAQAIEFGDVADGDTAVARAKAEPHNYGLLTELNTRPRTTYTARISNPITDREA